MTKGLEKQEGPPLELQVLQPSSESCPAVLLPRCCSLPDTAQSCSGLCWEWHSVEQPGYSQERLSRGSVGKPALAVNGISSSINKPTAGWQGAVHVWVLPKPL